MVDKKMMNVTLFRSMNGRHKSHQACVRGLGLRRLNQKISVEDTPATRGMLDKVSYLVKVEES
ncbi:MAG: 50S ribosomal protein L30 [Gammaproteobacteria bacterium]|nr:50S ribosomal protein L30 [Gammaproteobacteria bacterium]